MQPLTNICCVIRHIFYFFSEKKREKKYKKRCCFMKHNISFNFDHMPAYFFQIAYCHIYRVLLLTNYVIKDKIK